MIFTRSFLIFLLCLTCLSFNAQSVEITKEDSEDLNQFANSIRDIKTFSSKYTFVKLIECETIEKNPSNGGSTIQFNLYIMVKERTDFSMISKGSFWVDGDFRDPRNYQISADMKKLTFQHGAKQQPATTILKISTSEIEHLN